MGGWFTTRDCALRRLLRRCRTGVRWGRRRLISWLRVSLAVWRCVELEPVLATAGADYARHWRGYIASLCAPRALVARRRQQRLKDGRGAGLENAVSEYCRHFCSG